MWKKPGGPLIETNQKKNPPAWFLLKTPWHRLVAGIEGTNIADDQAIQAVHRHEPLEIQETYAIGDNPHHSYKNPDLLNGKSWDLQYSSSTVELSKTVWFVLKASILMSIWRIQKFQSEIQITRKFSGMMFVFVKTKLHTWRESCQGHSWDLMHFTVKGRGSFKIMLSKKQGSNAENEIGNINWMACQNFRSSKSCKKWAVVSKKINPA